MPTGGSATYDGLVGVIYDPGEEFAFDAALADLRLNANFSNSSITGTMTNWVGEEAGRIDGQLQVSDGRISGNEFGAEASGTLSANGRSADVNLDMDGDFLGSSGQAVGGWVDGTINHRDGYVGGVEGIFGAERR